MSTELHDSAPLPRPISAAPEGAEQSAETDSITNSIAGAHAQVVVNDAADRDNIVGSLRELWQHRVLIRELAQRDLKLRYKNSVAGIAWSLLNPIMLIFVITMMLKFGKMQTIDDYSAYLFGIIFLYIAFQNALLDGCISILANAGLVRKVFFPRAILPIVSLLANAFHFGVAFVFTLIYFFVLRTYPEQLDWHFFMVFPAVFFMGVLALGLSFILAYLNVFYEDVRFIVQAILQLVFYVMPVFITIEQVAAHPKIYPLYMINPLAALLVTYQRALLRPPGVPGLAPIDIPWSYFALACVSSTLILLIGFRLFEHYKWEIVERI